MVRIKLKYLLVLLVILYVCSLASALEEKTRQKQPKPRGINSRHQPSRRSLTIKERPNINKFTSGDLTDRKVSNRLIGGGHLKLESSNLDRDDDVAQWDDGLFLSSAGNGKEKKLKKPEDDDDDDDKKTLAQQVKEGKYGLIQTEIYGKKPKRPGIISYQSNPEVPKDNLKNLGGLDEEEIWLAENHVLVLRGGNFPAQNTEQQPTGDLQGWSPIDNYEAPKRQVKIPEKPKIPPPFPIQLIENGPVKILENNDTAINDNKPTWLDALIVASNDTLYKKIVGNNTKSSDNNNNNNDDKNINSGQVLGGVVGPFYPSLPPGAVFVPPPNQTDYDEDDQSIYYPPAYSFKYYQENSTAVPPGPLVPGIILPPPPNFFSQLQENKTTTLPPPSPSTTIKLPSTKYQKRPTTPKSLETYYPSRKSNTKPYKTSYSSTVSTTKELSRPFTMKPINKYKQQKNVTISFTETITKPPERIPIIVVTTTTPLPKQDSTLEKTLSSTKKSINWNTDDVASKSAPIVAYYPSTTTTTTPQPTIDDAIEATPVSIKNIITDKLPPNVPSSASYYFYEESNDSSPGTTSNSIYFEETTESPYYQVKDAQESQSKKPYYNVQVTPSQQTAEDYSVEVIEPILKTPGRYHQYSQQTLRSQGQRLLSDPLPLFYQTVTERPNQLGLQNFFTTPLTKEKIKFDQNTKSKPVYQYSFEAADYSKHERQSSPLYKQNIPNQQLKKHVAFNEWQEVQDDAQQQQQYNDYEAEVISEPRVQTEQNHYRQRLPVVFPTTTSRPINHLVDTTPNPQHSYYTKQDDTYLDDVTREYFTNFGKKIKPERLSSTTPIYGKTSSVTERPERPQTYPTVNSFINNNNNDDDYENQKVYKTPRVNVHYGDQPQGHYSLEDDTRVNYQRPLPQINPDAEYLPGFSQKPNNHQILERYQQQQNIHKNTYLSNLPTRKLLLPVDNYNNKQILRQGLMPLDDSREPIKQQIFRQRPISLSGDISVNYRNPRPQINPDSEYIDPTNRHAIINNDKPSSYFAYRLPGDGGHFYFLTPHAITQRQDGNSGFIYPQKREPRRAATVGNNPS